MCAGFCSVSIFCGLGSEEAQADGFSTIASAREGTSVPHSFGQQQRAAANVARPQQQHDSGARFERWVLDREDGGVLRPVRNSNVGGEFGNSPRNQVLFPIFRAENSKGTSTPPNSNDIDTARDMCSLTFRIVWSVRIVIVS